MLQTHRWQQEPKFGACFLLLSCFSGAAYVHRLAAGRDAALTGAAIGVLYVAAKLTARISLVGLAYAGEAPRPATMHTMQVPLRCQLCREGCCCHRLLTVCPSHAAVVAAAFSLPKVYELKKDDIDRVIEIVRKQVRAREWGKGRERGCRRGMGGRVGNRLLGSSSLAQGCCAICILQACISMLLGDSYVAPHGSAWQ